MRPDLPVDDVDGEWVNIEDDHDDEITFRANANPEEIVPNDQLGDTLLYVPSPRQQDECQDQQNEQGDNLQEENFVYDEDYQTLNPPDQFDDMVYTINNYWNELLYNEDTNRQVGDDLGEQETRYVTSIQDGYTIEQSVQEEYDNDIEELSNVRAQEVFIAYTNLNFTQAKEVYPNWALTPVKVVGPEPEARELFLHEQDQSEALISGSIIKKELPSLTSTPSKKTDFEMGEEIYPIQTPKVQSQSTAKLTNMFAEDLPNSDEKLAIKKQQLSPLVNTYNICFTVLDAAGDYDLFAPNRGQPNNNNANRGRPGRGRAPVRGVPNRGALGRAMPGRGAIPYRGGMGRAARGRGVPACGRVPRRVPRRGNPQREQGPRAVPGRNSRGNPQPPNDIRNFNSDAFCSRILFSIKGVSSLHYATIELSSFIVVQWSNH